MLSNIYDINNYLLNLENNVNNLKTTRDSLIFEISTREIINIILQIREIYCNKKDLFNIYIKKEIFGNILSFLPQKYIMLERSTCKNWYKILTNNFLKNTLGPFIKPFNMDYVGYFTRKFENIYRVKNKLCGYNYYDGYIRILNNNGVVVEKHKIGKKIYKITENMNLIWKNHSDIIIGIPNKKISISNNGWYINDIKMNQKYIYVLGRFDIFKYDSEGTYIERWEVNNCMVENRYGKIILHKDEIYVLYENFKHIIAHSNKTTHFNRKIGCFNKKFTRFDIYKNYIYIIDEHDKLIRIFEKYGSEICSKKNKITGCEDLIVIDENLFVITNDKIHIYKIRFF